MKEKIKEVQRYFIDKLLNSDFKVINCSEFFLSIKIDNEYVFYIWTKNGPSCRTTDMDSASNRSFIILDMSIEEKTLLYNITEPIVYEYYQRKADELEREKYEELKKKYETE